MIDTISIVKTAFTGDQYNLPGECNADKPWTLWNLNDKYTSMMKARILVNENYPETLLMKGRDIDQESIAFNQELTPFDAKKALQEIEDKISLE